MTTTTITYTSDNLYRLTNATYSTGESFDYTYDAVGNRLTQTTITNTTVYTYDDANRLINVGGGHTGGTTTSELAVNQKPRPLMTGAFFSR